MQVINTNVASLNAQRALTASQEAQQTAMERLSSGTRINRAKDDAAGLSISDHMTAQIRSLNQAVRNTNDGISYVQTAEGALGELTDMMQRVRELAVQSENGTLNSAQQDYIDVEILGLVNEMSNVIANTKFNDLAVFTNDAIDIQAGWESGDTISVGFTSVTDLNGLTELTNFTNTSGTADAAAIGLGNIDTALENIATKRATLGAQQNRLEHNASNLMNVSENISAARSRVLDADFAAESAELARTNVLQQAGMAMLSQANASSQQVLMLLGR